MPINSKDLVVVGDNYHNPDLTPASKNPNRFKNSSTGTTFVDYRGQAIEYCKMPDIHKK